MMKIKLAEALLRRKELQNKVAVLAQIKQQNLFEVRAQRVRVTDSLDDVTAHVPKLKTDEFTANFDWHARQLRLIDAAIQQANWTCEVDLQPSIMQDYEEISRK